MSSGAIGLTGLVLGLVFAVLGAVAGRWRARRLGETADAATVLGVAGWRSPGVEQHVLIRAAAFAFAATMAAAVVVAVVQVFTGGERTGLGVVLSIGGAAFGIAMFLLTRRVR